MNKGDFRYKKLTRNHPLNEENVSGNLERKLGRLIEKVNKG